MPELPEVEVVRRDLAAEAAGQRVEDVAVTGARTVRRQDPVDFAAALTGATLGRPGRVGKYLVVPLDGGGRALVVHLRMSGQLLLAEPGAPRVRHTHAVVSLSGGRELRFVDPRTFGELFVADTPVAALAHLGPDPLDAAWTADRLAATLHGRRTALKPLLMDQRHIAGIGNIYSDEALFEAGLRFDRPAGTLTDAEVARLHRAVGATLVAAVEHRGSSLADAGYVDLHGRPGGYRAHHRVYGREGQPCVRCGGPVARLRLGGRSTFLCPACQP